jgi:hypothetical protein
MGTIAALEARTGKMTPISDVLEDSRVATVGIGRTSLLARLKSWTVSFVSPDTAVQLTRVPQLRTVRGQADAQFVPSCKIVSFLGSAQVYLRRLAVDMRARFASSVLTILRRSSSRSIGLRVALLDRSGCLCRDDEFAARFSHRDRR